MPCVDHQEGVLCSPCSRYSLMPPFIYKLDGKRSGHGQQAVLVHHSLGDIQWKVLTKDATLLPTQKKWNIWQRWSGGHTLL